MAFFAADPGRRGCTVRVSNVATATAEAGGASCSSHSGSRARGSASHPAAAPSPCRTGRHRERVRGPADHHQVDVGVDRGRRVDRLDDFDRVDAGARAQALGDRVREFAGVAPDRLVHHQCAHRPAPVRVAAVRLTSGYDHGCRAARGPSTGRVGPTRRAVRPVRRPDRRRVAPTRGRGIRSTGLPARIDDGSTNAPRARRRAIRWQT